MSNVHTYFLVTGQQPT